MSERLVKIRATCKTTGGAHFSVASAQAKGAQADAAANGANGAPHTPRRRGPRANGSGPTSKSGGTGKRKRSGLKTDDEDATPVMNGSGGGRGAAGAPRVKCEGSGAEGSDAESPSKRVRSLDLDDIDVFGHTLEGFVADEEEEAV